MDGPIAQPAQKSFFLGLGKESLSRSNSIKSIMEHVEGMFCLGRRGEEMGNGVSDLGFIFLRVGELNVWEGVGYIEV